MISPEIQFNELKEKLRNAPPDQQINWTMPAKHKQNRQINWEVKTMKQTKQKYTHC